MSWHKYKIAKKTSSTSDFCFKRYTQVNLLKSLTIVKKYLYLCIVWTWNGPQMPQWINWKIEEVTKLEIGNGNFFCFAKWQVWQCLQSEMVETPKSFYKCVSFIIEGCPSLKCHRWLLEIELQRICWDWNKGKMQGRVNMRNSRNNRSNLRKNIKISSAFTHPNLPDQKMILYFTVIRQKIDTIVILFS